RLVSDGLDDVAAFPDLEPDSRRRGDVAAAQVAVEEPELSRARLRRVERDPLTAAMGVEEPVGARDAFPPAERAAAMQVVVREAAADQRRHGDRVERGHQGLPPVVAQRVAALLLGELVAKPSHAQREAENPEDAVLA